MDTTQNQGQDQNTNPAPDTENVNPKPQMPDNSQGGTQAPPTPPAEETATPQQ